MTNRLLANQSRRHAGSTVSSLQASCGFEGH